VIFQRDCGATTNFSTQVSILRASSKLPGKPGNILALGGHPDGARVKVTWDSNRAITIHYTDLYPVLYQESSFRDIFTVITIRYVIDSDP
jgi:hypothetical protein